MLSYCQPRGRVASLAAEEHMPSFRIHAPPTPPFPIRRPTLRDRLRNTTYHLAVWYYDFSSASLLLDLCASCLFTSFNFCSLCAKILPCTCTTEQEARRVRQCGVVGATYADHNSHCTTSWLHPTFLIRRVVRSSMPCLFSAPVLRTILSASASARLSGCI